jgi:hypothetical protein
MSISITRLMKRIRGAVFRGHPESISQPTQSPPPALNAGPGSNSTGPDPAFDPVPRPDAVAKLSQDTGDYELDRIHEALIDCIQHGYIDVFCDSEGEFRYKVTDAGQSRINRFFGLEGPPGGV